MKAEFGRATIKIWFNALSTSRNFTNVVEIVQEGNTALVITSKGNQHLINMSNVNLIEEI